MDGDGPVPSFFWGHRHLPTSAEYYGRRTYYDAVYLLPYIVAGLFVTIIGCGIAPQLLRRLKLLRQPFWGAGAATLVLLLLLAVMSDAGVLLGFWAGPLFLLHGGFDIWCVLALSKVLLPAGFLSGVVELGTQRVSTLHEHAAVVFARRRAPR